MLYSQIHENFNVFLGIQNLSELNKSLLCGKKNL